MSPKPEKTSVIPEHNGSSQRHLIMGTAGHVDHGKTALVKALTGFDCDTHREEKQRGITINLGFAHLNLPAGDSLSIVDVPGHKDFIRTMVAGASGIDFGLMVIAADSGIMPQTREHLQIMQILGVRSGLIAITKTDIVDSDILEMAKEETDNFVKGTFLEGSPVVCVSSKTGEGIPQLKTLISEQAANISNRHTGEVFRMYIDRIFSVKGFGTVVTGSVISGKLETTDSAFLLPAGKELRVRRIERHNKEAYKVVAGDRASINLAGLDVNEFKRGMVISDRVLRSSSLLDVNLKLFENAKKTGLWSQAHFHLGTYEAQVKIHLINNNSIRGGETSLAQIHLPFPCIAQSGDRFVLRSSSNDITLGGGEIIDAFPLHHRRRTNTLLERMTRIAEGKLTELIASEVQKAIGAAVHSEIADKLNVSSEKILSVVNGNMAEDILSFNIKDTVYLIHRTVYEKWRNVALRSITSFHKRNPLEPGGRTVEETAGAIGIERDKPSCILLREMFSRLEKEKKLKRVGNTWAIANHTVNIDPVLKKQIEFIRNLLTKAGMHTPLISELKQKTDAYGINAQNFKKILRFLVKRKEAYFIDDNYIHASVVDKCRKVLLNDLVNRHEGIKVSEFRDLINGNRKICLLLLNIYDREGVTVRKDDVRLITDKGRKISEG